MPISRSKYRTHLISNYEHLWRDIGGEEGTSTDAARCHEPW